MNPPATAASAEDAGLAPSLRQDHSLPPITGSPQLQHTCNCSYEGETRTLLWHHYNVPTVFQHGKSKGTPKRSFSITQQNRQPLRKTLTHGEPHTHPSAPGHMQEQRHCPLRKLASLHKFSGEETQQNTKHRHQNRCVHKQPKDFTCFSSCKAAFPQSHWCPPQHVPGLHS